MKDPKKLKADTEAIFDYLKSCVTNIFGKNEYVLCSSAMLPRGTLIYSEQHLINIETVLDKIKKQKGEGGSVLLSVFIYNKTTGERSVSCSRAIEALTIKDDIIGFDKFYQNLSSSIYFCMKLCIEGYLINMK